MKRCSLSIVLILIFIPGALSQQPKATQIENIRTQYNEISKRIAAAESNEESGRTSDLAVNELVVNKLNQSWAAVGIYQVVFRFYYQNKLEEPYPTQLVKITREADVSARHYYEEFVFDNEGDLIFYFEKSEDGEFPLERRVYFQQNEPIRISEDTTVRDKLSSTDLSIVSGITEKNAKFIQIFNNSIEE